MSSTHRRGAPHALIEPRVLLLGTCLLIACGSGSTGYRAMPAAAAQPAAVAASDRSPAEPPARFAALVERARRLAAAPPIPPRRAEFGARMADLSYDQYRSIRFRPERSLWRGQPGRFEVQFFHPGFYFRDLVTVRVIAGDRVRPLTFSTDLFAYEDAPLPEPDAALGFTGLRLHAPINTDTYRDEVIVFQGASYFRSLGKHQVYGLSARGLALQTGEPGPEEFPRFSELELVEPGPEDEHAWVLALLESKRVTGAYAFRVHPGVFTTVEVTMRVFLREPVPVLGVAPFSSMYLFGEEGPARFGDFRPEVHDSDGLAMHTREGEWLFRPLRNPHRTTVSSFRLDSPRGFGLLQRDREFTSYQDLEARYQDWPSAWVEPIGDWGRGALRLLEIATELETDDNIAALWVPDEVPRDGLALRYRLHFGPDVPSGGPAGRAVSTRIRVDPESKGERARFIVDFDGPSLEEHERGVQVEVTTPSGRVTERHAERNPFTRGWRASFEVEAATRDVELRAFLRSEAGHALTETWSYLWQPES